MTKRNLSFLPLSVLLLATASIPAVYAQTGTQTTVLADPTGPWFSVDGTTYFGAMSAFWPVGSLHTLSIPQGAGGYSYSQTLDTQWQFLEWQWATGTSSSPTIQVYGNVGSTKFTAMFNTQYLLTTQVACNPAPCASVPGTILMNGSPAPSQPTWQSPGAAQNLAIFSAPGYIFAGWQVGNNPIVPFQIDTVTVNAPTVVTAIFVPAKSINFVTNPPNLTFYADGVLLTTPTTLSWGLGSRHTIGGLNTETDIVGKSWIFSSWNDGGAQTHTYVVGNNFQAETITATYVPAAWPFFTTSPPNLALVVDNQVLPPPYSYEWAIGSTHSISATTPQKDAQGNTWVFQSWGDAVTTPSRKITIPVGADVNGYGLVAVFTQQTQAKLTVNSSISGQVVTVNGSSCTTPCSLSFNVGTQVHASAPATVSVNGVSRQDLLGWSSGGGAPAAGDWIAPLSASTTSITATYQLMNSLSTGESPSRSGTWRIVPASPDGFYNSEATVTLHVEPRPGYQFSNWSGDLSGSTPSGTLTMNVPHRVSAQFAAVPSLSRGGVRNGAGVGPASGLAAGSVASIFGENLTSRSAVAPANRLATTLSDVTVHVGTRSAALYFASPAQINFQIPADLAPGSQTVTVSSPGMPDVTSELDIVRNAPGLFPAVLDGQTYAMVMHEDGTPVTAANPARQGELLTAYGTGFGPTDHVRPEAVPVPTTPAYRVLDRVTIQVGSGAVTSESAFAVPGRVGIDAVQFRLDSSAPSGAAIPIYLTVNGVISNTLPLAIQ